MTAVPISVPLLTTSERRAFKRCPARWWWEYREGLRAYETDLKLWFGIGVHIALAHYYGNKGYKRNLDFIDVWRAFVDEDPMSEAIRTRPFDDAEQQWVDARLLGETMLRGYHEFYGGDRHWDVIYVEEPFQIGIPDPRDPDSDLVLLTSTFDGVFRDKNDRMIKLMEHKTAGSISLGHLPMDDQGGVYASIADWVLTDQGILAKGQHIKGIEYNFLRKALPDDRPKDAEGYATNKATKQHYIAALEAQGVTEIGGKPLEKALGATLMEEASRLGLVVVGERSQVQPPPLFVRETVTRTRRAQAAQITRLQAEALAMEPFRLGHLKPYKTPTRDCSWDCPFYNMCELEDAGGDWQEFKDGVFVQVDPYDRYRKSAAEGI